MCNLQVHFSSKLPKNYGQNSEYTNQWLITLCCPVVQKKCKFYTDIVCRHHLKKKNFKTCHKMYSWYMSKVYCMNYHGNQLTLRWIIQVVYQFVEWFFVKENIIIHLFTNTFKTIYSTRVLSYTTSRLLINCLPE